MSVTIESRLVNTVIPQGALLGGLSKIPLKKLDTCSSCPLLRDFLTGVGTENSGAVGVELGDELVDQPTL